MTRHHFRLIIFNALECDDRVQENGRLRHLRLPQFLLSAREHTVGNPKTKRFIGLLE